MNKATNVIISIPKYLRDYSLIKSKKAFREANNARAEKFTEFSIWEQTKIMDLQSFASSKTAGGDVVRLQWKAEHRKAWFQGFSSYEKSGALKPVRAVVVKK